MTGPQNIRCGYIYLNGTRMNDEKDRGYFKWSRKSWRQLLKRKQFEDPVTEVQIGDKSSGNRI